VREILISGYQVSVLMYHGGQRNKGTEETESGMWVSFEQHQDVWYETRSFVSYECNCYSLFGTLEEESRGLGFSEATVI